MIGFLFDTEEELAGQSWSPADDPALVERMGFRAGASVEAECDSRVCGRRPAAVDRN